MKNGILVCKAAGQTKNIGDYIQSVAGESFFDKYDCFVERETLSTFQSSEPVNTIMNGWYMWNPENFPPTDSINPLYISFHISPQAKDKMLSGDGINHLRKYSPIGTRDYATLRILQEHNIDGYFSGCLTLTLGNKYKTEECNNKVYIVEPYYEFGRKNGKISIKAVLMDLYYGAKYFNKVLKISRKFIDETLVIKGSLYSVKRFLKAACFYNTYHKAFADNILLNAEYISHIVNVSDYDTNEKMMTYAKELIHKYSKAGIVITSRIHCALPCLALETPVIFVNSETLASDSYRPGGRFEGIADLFNMLYYTEEGLRSNNDNINVLLKSGKISLNSTIDNPGLYKKLCGQLNETVVTWLKEKRK